jgi:hypothetical protein
MILGSTAYLDRRTIPGNATNFPVEAVRSRETEKARANAGLLEYVTCLCSDIKHLPQIDDRAAP